MEYFIYAIQVIGIIIPLAGIIALLRRKHQNNNSMFLMVTNIGCLLMNSGYLLMLNADDAGQAMIINKVEYLGNVLFYYFFVVFLVSYLWRKYPKGLLYLWAAFEGFGVLLYWNDGLRQGILRGQPFLTFERSTRLGVYTMNMNQNIVYMVRYSWISFLLLWMLIYSNIRLFRMKDMAARANLARIIGAEFVIMLSLIGYLIFEPVFDFVPVLASLSILAIILSVINDEFYGITEMGHEWVFEQMNDAFIIVDKNYGYLDANSYGHSIFTKLNQLEKQVRIPDEIYRLFTDREDTYQNNGKYYEKKIMEISDKGAVAGYSMLLVDVTKRQELMERVQEEKERADAANQAKSAFVSNVSHEIRTPMNAIVGMTQILLRKDLPKQEHDYIVNIQNSGNALLTIINDILDMSKIESGKMELVEEDYDFMAMLSDLGMIILNRIGNKPVELIFDIDPDMPDKLYGDALRIRQIIINLMNNATKFTEQGYVALSVSVKDRKEDDVELAVSVRDSGQGIREEDLPKLFGSFQQVDVKKNHRKEGTGLGLSISKQLVELMHGSIGVKSEYGKGSEFYFTIHQRIAGQDKAATVRAVEDTVFVAGRMENTAAQKQLQKLAENYGLPYVDDILSAKHTDRNLYYFTDCYRKLSEEERNRLAESGTEVYVLQNPMLESEEPEGVRIMNKPLYSFNFCQAISNADAAGSKEPEAGTVGRDRKTDSDSDTGSFIAPDAKILVVDDNEINRMVVEEMLEPLQSRIDTAENGAEAVEMVQKTKYDIVLMDHIMPVMNGIEAAKAIRALGEEQYRMLPIIALTANDVSGEQNEYLKAGMNDCIGKPIVMEDIYSKIRKWLPEEKVKQVPGKL